MNEIKLGQYVHSNSLLHVLDPRTKIICCTIMIISVMISYNWYYLLSCALLTLTVIKIAGMNVKFIINNIRKIRSLLLVTFVFQAFLCPGDPLFQIGIISVTREGLTLAVINLFRLLILYFGSMILLMTTTPIKLSAGIDYLLLPLTKLKLPVHNFSTILSISFRFIPSLIEEATNIKNAQRARGAQFDSPQIMLRLKSYLAILIPLFEASLLRAEELGEAMDSRSFTGHPNKLRMSSLKFRTIDIVTLAFMFVVLCAGLFPVAS